ncbi:SDR family oxidoreductase [Phenylobacterium sp. LjRoot219]|uniref:SDR family oxidoreductase n=1 Tax=Phenylobacterium sp. LjRoot219 TaxID=3342283 RepID=UPI003ED0D73B
MADAERKVAFVTGASSGIGRAAAEAFIARGYATALVDRDEAAGLRLEAELRGSGDCIFIPCDVTDDESVRRAVATTVERYGRLDAAFNAAGIDGEHGKATADGSMENWSRVIAIDLTGVWSCMRYQIPQMLKSGGGSIVNCASVAGLVGAPFFSAYVAAKHGVVGLTKTAALEYARQGIRVNAVCPGMIDTPMSRAGMTPELAEALIAESAIGRLGEPEEVARAVVWLCDEAPGFLTGQAIAVDGAWTAR